METDTQNYSLIRPQTTRGESTLEIKGGSIQVAFAKSRPASDFAGITYNAGTPKITVPTGYKLWIKANSAAVSISDGVYNPEPLATASEIALTADSAHSITATWNAVAGAKSYALLLEGAGKIFTHQTTGTSHSFTGLTAKTPYTLRIKALPSQGHLEGAESNPVTAETQDVPEYTLYKATESKGTLTESFIAADGSEGHIFADYAETVNQKGFGLIPGWEDIWVPARRIWITGKSLGQQSTLAGYEQHKELETAHYKASNNIEGTLAIWQFSSPITPTKFVAYARVPDLPESLRFLYLAFIDENEKKQEIQLREEQTITNIHNITKIKLLHKGQNLSQIRFLNIHFKPE